MTTLTDKIEAALAPFVNIKAPFAQQLVLELTVLIGTHEQQQAYAADRELTGDITDKDRLDYIEKWTRKSTTGISFDHIPSVDGEPSGFRFMRRHYVGEARKSLRSIIDAEIKRDRDIP